MNHRNLTLLWRLSLAGLVASIALMSSVPPVSRDALTHHLAVPKIYVETGGIHELPHIIPSYYPQLLDLLYCIPMIFGNDIIPKYIHFSFALLTALLIFLFLKKRLSPLYGWFGALFFLSLPVIVKLSVTVYVDLGLIFFSTAALLSLVRWRETSFNLKWLLISGILCGLAMGCKYNGLVTCFLMSVLIPWIFFKAYKNQEVTVKHTHPASGKISNWKAQAQALGYGVLFLLVSLGVFSPWMIKNYIWTQNPVYPLYDTYFNPKPESGFETSAEESTMNHFILRKIIYKESLLETLTIPIRIFFQGQDDNPKYFDGRLNPLLFFLPIFAFVFYKKYRPLQESETNQLLILFSILYILIVFFRQDMRIRWIGPAIPPLVILSAYGLRNTVERLAHKHESGLETPGYKFNVQQMIFMGIVALVAGLNLVYIVGLYRTIDPMPYLTGQVSRDEYIEKFRPEYPGLQYANQQLDGQTKTLAFFLGNRIYYSDHEIRGNQLFFKHLIESAQNPEALAKKLKKEKITTLIINIPAFNNWVTSTFDSNERQTVQDFFKGYTRLLFSKNNRGVFALL